MYIFSAGEVYAVPLTDAAGNVLTNATPVKIATVQEITLDVDAGQKELHGQNQFAADVARTKAKLAGKLKAANINGMAFNSLFFGQGMSQGTMHAIYTDTTGAAIPVSPFAIAVTPPSSGTYVADMGVIDANGIPMSKVASGLTSGQYSVTGSTYTFAAADVGKAVFINYRYSMAATNAKKLAVTNQLMGASPLVQLMIQATYRGNRVLAVLYSAMFSKLHLLGTKVDDYSIPEMDFAGFANASQQVMDLYISE